MNTKVQAKFVLDSTTPGAVKYREQLEIGRYAQYPNSPGAKIGILYVRKAAFQGLKEYPNNITVTVEETTRETPVKEGTSGQLG